MFIDHDKNLLLSEHLFVSKTRLQIILASFTANKMKNLACIPFFISLLTLLSGIILKIVFLLSQCIGQTWQKPEKDFDIFKEAGGPYKAIQREYKGVMVTDGKLRIKFTPKIENPAINGIEILAE